MTQGKSRMRQFRTSGSVRGVAREGDSYRDKVQSQIWNVALGNAYPQRQRCRAPVAILSLVTFGTSCTTATDE